MSEQNQLFNDDDLIWWKKYWHDMPEYEQEDLKPIKTVVVKFDSWEYYEKFREMMGQTMTKKTTYIWFPKHKDASYKNKRWVNDEE